MGGMVVNLYMLEYPNQEHDIWLRILFKVQIKKNKTMLCNRNRTNLNIILLKRSFVLSKTKQKKCSVNISLPLFFLLLLRRLSFFFCIPCFLLQATNFPFGNDCPKQVLSRKIYNCSKRGVNNSLEISPLFLHGLCVLLSDTI